MNVLVGLLTGIVVDFVGKVADVCPLQIVGIVAHGFVISLSG